MSDNEIRERVISNGVRNIREFGFPQCNSENILTDKMFSEFFRSALKDNLGASVQIDRVINAILAELPSERKPATNRKRKSKNPPPESPND